MSPGLILMRRLFTILTAAALLLVSLAIGTVAADLPFWRRALQLPLSTDTLYLPVVSIGAPAPAGAAASPRVAAAVDQEALEATVARARTSGVRALLATRG